MTDTTDTQPELTQEQKDAAAAAAYQAQKDGPAAEPIIPADKPTRPEHIPEKFWDAEKGEVNVEAMAKSYLELEKLKGKAEDKPDGDKPADTPADEDPKAAFAALREATTAALAEHGAPTDEQYAAYEKIGLSREDVDEFIEFQKSKGEALLATEVFGAVGGEEKYVEMIDWARTAYSPDEIKAYDRDLDSKDPAVRKAAIEGLKARYVAANGSEGRNVTKTSGVTVTAPGYASKAEMVADMASPKYAKDPAFRAEVARKVEAARRAGVQLM